jgi:hypothetical protein
MQCTDCNHYNKYKKMCKVTHVANTISCPAISNEQIDNAEICYNCQYWLGGGDWGTSCKVDYYKCSVNGFNKACEKFEREVRL